MMQRNCQILQVVFVIPYHQAYILISIRIACHVRPLNSFKKLVPKSIFSGGLMFQCRNNMYGRFIDESVLGIRLDCIHMCNPKLII